MKTKGLIRRAWTMLAAAAIGVPLLLTGGASAVPDPTYPALPKMQNTQWLQSSTTSLNQVIRQRQYFRIPPAMAIVDMSGGRVPSDRTCTKDPPYSSTLSYNNRVYIVPPAGKDAPHDQWGKFPPVTVRAVAFGNIPVEVTTQISQLRDAEGLPVPLRAVQDNKTFCPLAALKAIGYPYAEQFFQANDYLDPKLLGAVSVDVLAVKVDGVPLEVGPRCRTATPVALDLAGTGYIEATAKGQFERTPPYDRIPPEQLPPNRDTKYYAAVKGGYLHGAIDIPPFTDCGVDGEDLSPLLTGSISGPDNPVEVYQGYVNSTAICPSLTPGPFCPLPAPFAFPKEPVS